MTLQAYEFANTASQPLTSAGTAYTAPVWLVGATWITPTAAQMCRLGKLQPDWDSYGAAPVSASAVDLMITLLAGVMNPNSPAPTLVPSAQGHLQAEWHTKGIDLEVEAVDPTHIVVDYEGPGGGWSETLSLDLRKLVSAINRLSTP